MTKKEWILLAAMLLFCISVANAQVDFKNRCIDVVRGARVEIVDSPEAYNLGTSLAVTFYQEGNKAVEEQAGDPDGKDWYEALDMYYCKDQDCLLQTIAKDDKAYFRKSKYAAIYTTFDGELYFVAVFSW